MKEFQSLIIEETPKTPQIELNPLTGDFIFSGRSIPENAAKVYEPILNWVTEYISTCQANNKSETQSGIFQYFIIIMAGKNT